MKIVDYRAGVGTSSRHGRLICTQTMVILTLTLPCGLVGCTTQPSEKKSARLSQQESPAPMVDPVEKEHPATQKQETLAAVEEFLARTQEYRIPAKTEPVANVAPSGTVPFVPPLIPGTTPQMPVSLPHDTAFANTQIAVGETTPSQPTQAIPAIESVSVRSAQARNDGTPSTSGPKVTNGPVDLQTNDRIDSAELLVASLKEELKTKQDASTEWKLRFLLLALERDVEEAGIGEYAPPDMKGILPAWGATSSAIRSMVRNPSQGVESALEQVDAFRARLALRSDPLVKHVALCRKVATFGSYEEMSANELVSGRSIQTIVYAEIENLRPIAEPGGAFETKLSTRLEIMTADGKSMWHREEPEVIDRCRRPRRDFFVAQRITLPPTLPVGDYVLKFSIEDKTSGRVAESTVPFVLLSPISVARGQ